MTAGLLVQMWCRLVHNRFTYYHRGGQGRGLPNVYWDYSWAYTAFAALLTILVFFLHRTNRKLFYEATVQFGYWLLVLWAGFALIAMEISFVPDFNLRGEAW